MKSYIEKIYDLVPCDLLEYALSDIIPIYDQVDRAHGRSHIFAVLKESFKLGRNYNLNYAMIFIIAIYHDIGIINGRKLHHIHSGEYLIKDIILRKWFNEYELKIMQEAVEDHRLSSINHPRSIYGCIIRDADLDLKPRRVIRRAIQFEIHKNQHITCEECCHMVSLYLKERYCLGEIRFLLPESNEQRLVNLQLILNDISILKKTCEKYYFKELKLRMVFSNT